MVSKSYLTKNNKISNTKCVLVIKLFCECQAFMNLLAVYAARVFLILSVEPKLDSTQVYFTYLLQLQNLFILINKYNT